jgi:hypothetical protein
LRWDGGQWVKALFNVVCPVCGKTIEDMRYHYCPRMRVDASVEQQTILATFTLQDLLAYLEDTAEDIYNTEDEQSEYAAGMYYVINEIKYWIKATGA